MLIDWFTVGAQIVNFLVLVALLKRFLFDRIVSAIDRREAEIAGQFSSARQMESLAEQAKNDYEQKMREIETDRASLLEDARRECQDFMLARQAEIRREIDADAERWRGSLSREQANLSRRLALLAVGQVRSSCQRILQDLADESLQAQAVAVFLSRIDSLEPDRRDSIGQAMLAGPGLEIEVRTATQLGDCLRDDITASLGRTFGERLSIRFTDDPDLLCGLELRAHGLVVGNSAGERLQALHSSLEKAVHDEVDTLRSETGAVDAAQE